VTVMVPNPEWWGAEKPTLDTLSKTVNTNTADYVVAVRNGDFDGGWAVPSPDLIAELEQEPSIHYATGTGGAVWGHVDFNMRTVPERAIRLALFTVFDVQDFLEIYHVGLVPPLR